jgi:hypothetical protein
MCCFLLSLRGVTTSSSVAYGRRRSEGNLEIFFIDFPPGQILSDGTWNSYSRIVEFPKPNKYQQSVEIH